MALVPVHEAIKRGGKELVTQPLMQSHLSLPLFGTLIKCAFVAHLIAQYSGNNQHCPKFPPQI